MTAPRTLDVIALGAAGLELHPQQLGAPLEAATSFTRDLGGSAARVAFGCARLGLRVALISQVGDDAAGRFAIAALAAEGCDVARVAVNLEHPTELRFAGEPRAPGTPDPAIADAAVDEAVVRQARALVVPLSCAQTAAGTLALDRARRHGVRTVLVIDEPPNAPAQLAGFDLVVGTRAELQRAGGSDDLVQALRALRGATKATIIVELGAAGCAIVEADVPAREADLRSVPGFACEPISRAGARDAFVAGLIHGWLHGMDWRQAAHRAHACGALVAGRAGGAAAMPAAAELEHFLKRPGPPDRDPVLARLHRVTPRRRGWTELCLISIDDRTQAYEMARAAGAPEARIGALKQLVVRAVAEVEHALSLNGKIGVLVDDTYGAAALAAAGGRGWWLARPVEIAGSSPLEFEGGRSIGTRLVGWPRDHVVKCKVLLHPDEPVLARLEQETQLDALYRAVIASGHELLVEVVVPAGLPSDDETIVRAVKRLYNIGIHPDWWGLEPMPAAVWRKLDELIAERDRHCRGVLLLDRGDRELAAAAAARSCRGGFIGRATLRAPSEAWLAGAIDDAAFVAQVRAACEQRVAAWQRARLRPGEAP